MVLPNRLEVRRLWPLSRATAHRRVATLMADAGFEDPQPCPRSLRHAYGVAAALGHASITTTAVYTAAAGLEARHFLGSSEGLCPEFRCPDLVR